MEFYNETIQTVSDETRATFQVQYFWYSSHFIMFPSHKMKELSLQFEEGLL